MRNESTSLQFDQPNVAVSTVLDNVERVVIGKSNEVRLCLVALLCGGHVLVEDVPGVGKTMLVRALAKSLGLTFKRIQFTPDLLPSDVTGVSIYNQKTLEFEYRPGPIHGQIVLADEINRTSPKTQAALLEAMEEGGVTVDGVTYELPQPFLLMATQNPIEYEGTFPLPEAQLDRFLLKISLGYPKTSDEVTILGKQQLIHPINEIDQVMNLKEIIYLSEQARSIHVEQSIREYIVRIVTDTRKHSAIYLGASPRGSLALFKATQAFALIMGREYVVPDDVKRLVHPTLAHRILLKGEARLSGINVDDVLKEIVRAIPIPVNRA